jgi:hypothetical protein
MCYPPQTASNLPPNCFTTVITIIKPITLHPSSFEEISSTLSYESTIYASPPTTADTFTGSATSAGSHDDSSHTSEHSTYMVTTPSINTDHEASSSVPEESTNVQQTPTPSSENNYPPPSGTSPTSTEVAETTQTTSTPSSDTTKHSTGSAATHPVTPSSAAGIDTTGTTGQPLSSGFTWFNQTSVRWDSSTLKNHANLVLIDCDFYST